MRGMHYLSSCPFIRELLIDRHLNNFTAVFMAGQCSAKGLWLFDVINDLMKVDIDRFSLVLELYTAVKLNPSIRSGILNLVHKILYFANDDPMMIVSFY